MDNFLFPEILVSFGPHLILKAYPQEGVRKDSRVIKPKLHQVTLMFPLL